MLYLTSTTLTMTSFTSDILEPTFTPRCQVRPKTQEARDFARGMWSELLREGRRKHMGVS